MKSNVFDFFFGAILVLVFTACGVMFLLADIHTEIQATIAFGGCFVFTLPALLFGALMGTYWIEDNISRD